MGDVRLWEQKGANETEDLTKHGPLDHVNRCPECIGVSRNRWVGILLPRLSVTPLHVRGLALRHIPYCRAYHAGPENQTHAETDEDRRENANHG